MKPFLFLKPSQARAFTAALMAVGLGSAPLWAQSGSSAGTGATTTAAARASDQHKLDRGDQSFIEKAAQSGVKEQAASQLAAERASNQRVREYAQQLVQDHQKVNQELIRLAESKGVEFEGELAQLRTAVQSKGAGTHHASTTGATHSATDPMLDRPRSTTTTASTTTRTPSTSAGAGTAGSAGSPQRQDAAHSDTKMKDRDLQRLSEASGRDFDERYVKLMVKEHDDAVKLFEKAAKDSKDTEIRSFASQHVSSLREHLQEAKSLERVVAE